MKYILIINILFFSYSCFSQQDTLCFEISQAKNILKFAEKGYYCDSLIVQYESRDSILKEIIQSKDKQLGALSGVISEQGIKIKRLKWIIGALSGLSLFLLIQFVTG